MVQVGAVKQPINAKQPGLYERDYYAWTNLMAERLRAKDQSDLDWDNLAEKIDSLGRSISSALKSGLRLLIMHLLKWKTQPERRSGSWRATIIEHRRRINDILEESPSLRYQMDDMVERAYGDAVHDAIVEMGLLQNPFDARCPYTADELRDIQFWPG